MSRRPIPPKVGNTRRHRHTNTLHKHFRDSIYSPLVLAHIRLHVDQEMSDGPSSANLYLNDRLLSVPTNSNDLAPWADYASHWCKWHVQQHVTKDGGGKMANRSYVEEDHNFVINGLSFSTEYLQFS